MTTPQNPHDMRDEEQSKSFIDKIRNNLAAFGFFNGIEPKTAAVLTTFLEQEFTKALSEKSKRIESLEAKLKAGMEVIEASVSYADGLAGFCEGYGDLEIRKRNFLDKLTAWRGQVKG